MRHSAEEKWPLIFETKQEMDDAIPSTPDLTPVRFFPPLFGSFDLNSLPRRSGLPKASSYQALTGTYARSTEHSGSSPSLSAHSTQSLRRVEGDQVKKTPPRSLGRKPGKKLFASLKDRDRHSPRLARLKMKSSMDVTRGHAHALSHLGLGHTRPFSVSTGELLSPDSLHKAR